MKTNFFALFFVIAAIFSLANRIVCGEVTSQKTAIASMINIVKNLDEINWLDEDKSVILLLGNTGCGKSTLATLLTNTSTLRSVGSAGEFLLKDGKRISEKSTTKSNTQIPEQVKNLTAGVVYYDFPGFEETRGLEYDLSLTYFIRKLLNYVDSVKFVFVIDHNSVKKEGDRNNFPTLARHATAIIKNITKNSDGIALVVTKVDSNVILQDDGTYKMVEDDTKKQAIIEFLAEMKNDLSDLTNKSAIYAQDRAIIDFIQIFLEEKDKIGLLRQPNEAGLVKDIPLMQNVTNNLN